MSMSDNFASRWPCGRDCLHADDLPFEGWVWCAREEKAPRHRSRRTARECPHFFARPLVKSADLLTRAAQAG